MGTGGTGGGGTGRGTKESTETSACPRQPGSAGNALKRSALVTDVFYSFSPLLAGLTAR